VPTPDHVFDIFKDWRVGTELPALDGVCPVCAGRLAHMVNLRHSVYTQMCISQADTYRPCGWHRRKTIQVKGKKR